jgi:adenine deaminase
MIISGKIIDIHLREIYGAMISVEDGIITDIKRKINVREQFILPGLVDSHVHIESSMLTPGAFATAVVSRGTVAVVSDPHEIANVLGVEGVKYMIEDAEKVPVKFFFGAPSCVPATTFETGGAVIGSEEIETLMQMPEIKFLSEMMNYPGVINEDPEVMKKIEAAKRSGRQIDGHAPGLTGEDLRKYISAGINTDHECSSLSEAKEKISLGMKIIIREGSAARNLDALKELLWTHPDMVMLCTDDIHPETLLKGHINSLVARLISEGFNLFDVIRSCTINPVKHYSLDAGLLRIGDRADFIVTDDLNKMEIDETWINGVNVFNRGSVMFKYKRAKPVNRFRSGKIKTQDISISPGQGSLRVIKAFDGKLITKEIFIGNSDNKLLLPDIENDILKIVIKDRYNDAPPATGFITGFGLKTGAFASSVAHDSHNIICIGADDYDIVRAINEVVRIKGGLAVSVRGEVDSLKLEIAGLMAGDPAETVAEKYTLLSGKAKHLGCKMESPFMTLSFMALLVIPELKMSDKGLFDGRIFRHVPLFTGA